MKSLLYSFIPATGDDPFTIANCVFTKRTIQTSRLSAYFISSSIITFLADNHTRKVLYKSNKMKKCCQHSVLYTNQYPRKFVTSTIAPCTGPRRQEQEQTPKATIAIHYVAGVNEEIRRICRRFNVKVAFKTKEPSITRE